MFHLERYSIQMLIGETTIRSDLDCSGLEFMPSDGCFPRSSDFIACVAISCSKVKNEQYPACVCQENTIFII